MKKLMATILAIGILFTGCSGSGGSSKDIDPAEAAKTLVDGVEFRDTLVLAEGDIASSYYKLDDTIESHAIYVSGSGGTAEEVAVLKVKDSKDAEAARSILEKRVEDLKFNFEDYVPSEMQKLKSPVIVISGNTAIMVIADDATAAKKAVQDLL